MPGLSRPRTNAPAEISTAITTPMTTPRLVRPCGLSGASGSARSMLEVSRPMTNMCAWT